MKTKNVESCDLDGKWNTTKTGMCHILPPTMLHVGDNCFANVIFQSIAFLNFEDEINHYMKASETWNNAKDWQYKQLSIPVGLQYDTKLISTFPTKSFKDFKPDAELILERALIRYNDYDIKEADGDNLQRSLFNHPFNLFIDTRYISQLGIAQKTEFYVKCMDLFSRFRLEYPVMLDEDDFGYFTSKRSINYDEYAVNDFAHANAMNMCSNETSSNREMENFTKI